VCLYLYITLPGTFESKHIFISLSLSLSSSVTRHDALNSTIIILLGGRTLCMCLCGCLCVRLCVCVCVCVHLCTCWSVYLFFSLFLYFSVCTYVCMYVGVHVWMCISYVHVYICVLLCVYEFVCVSVRADVWHPCFHTRMHTTYTFLQESAVLLAKGFVIKNKEHLINFRSFGTIFGENGARCAQEKYWKQNTDVRSM